MPNAADLFDVSDLDFQTKSSGIKEHLFQPKPDNGIAGVYSAIVRFVPYLKDKPNSIVTKYQIYLKDPLTGKGRYLDCPRTINQKDIISDAYWFCENSDDASLKMQSSTFSSSLACTGVIQVLHDPNKPENVGKLLLWNFGIKIKSKYDTEEKNSKRKPLDVINGRPFRLDVKMVKNFPNYDDCLFISSDDWDDAIPKWIGPNGERLDMSKKADQEVYAKYLMESSPDPRSEAYKEWTPEDEEYVNKIINMVINKESNGQIQSGMVVTEKQYGTKTKSTVAKTEDDDEIDDILENDAKLSKKAKASPKEEDVEMETDIDLSDLDDFDL